jgi:pleiotropic regulator 1
MATLTNHKKSVRALVAHPTEHAFASAGADNIKKFKLPNVRGLGVVWGEQC